jgi:hypothetical protein
MMIFFETFQLLLFQQHYFTLILGYCNGVERGGK